MNIEAEMKQAVLTAELAHHLGVSRIVILGAGKARQLYEVGEAFTQKLVEIEATGPTLKPLRCWLPLRNQDALLFGTLWGPETQHWAGKVIEVRTIVRGTGYRLRLQPGEGPV